MAIAFVFQIGHIPDLSCPGEVEYSDEFGAWWEESDEDLQEAVHTSVTKLSLKGPALGFPDSSQIKESKYGELRELRIQSKGSPWRLLRVRSSTHRVSDHRGVQGR